MSSPGGAFGRGLLAGAIVTLLLLVTIAPLREAVLPGAEGNDRIEEALGLIERSYFEEPDTDALEQESIRGMIRALKRQTDDRFSHYFSPEVYERFTSSTEGEFSGVGTSVTEVKRGLRVARVFEDAPAEKAGIDVGDLIVSVNGKSIAGKSATAAATRIKGEAGTTVTLGVVDGESGKKRSYEVERSEVRIPAVSGEIKKIDGTEIAYVRLETFSRGAHAELRQEIESQYRMGAEGLILDLRGNGGGLVQEAVLVTSIFQEEGAVLSTEGRTREERTLDVTGNALDPKPMVVLVNKDSASAAEIVTAALKQNEIATIVGTKTFGKGTFQEVIELEEGGGALDLTVGEYLTSDGSSILGKGVKPDVRVTAGKDSDDDRQLQRALELVDQKIGK